MMIIFFTFVVGILVTSKVEGDNCPVPLKDCSRENIQFFLYTNLENPPQELLLDNSTSIANATFVENADFKLLVHGYTQWKNAPDWLTVREEYFKEKQWNLIVVDYNPIARWGCYFDTLKKSVVQIGACIGNFLRQVFKEHPKITIDKFHFVGFSMGCQICAQASNNLQSTGLIIPRITGCDPALPGFTKIEKKKKSILNKQHAKFVDAIHSNMGQAGVTSSHAHFDFYANKGSVQPGCKLSDPACSHNRALKIFAESINSPVKLIARKCDSDDEWFHDKKCTGDHHLTKEVGEHCTPPKTDEEIGIYQFFTNAQKPFAKPLP